MQNAILNEYVTVRSNVSLTKTASENTIVIDNRSQSEGIEIFQVDEIGKYLISEINGLETINQFVLRFCSEYNLDDKQDVHWIVDFLRELQIKGAVEFTTKPTISSLKLVGDESIIKPLHATIEVTDKCNLTCKHCYINGQMSNTNTLELEGFIHLVDILKLNNVLNIELTGGEFFAHPNANQILELSLDSFNQVGLLTNGTYISDTAIDILTNYRHKLIVNISIDSINPQTHDWLRGVEGSHKRTLDNLKRLTERGIKVRISTVIFEQNLWEIEELIELAKQYKALTFTYSFVEQIGRGNDFTGLLFETEEELLNYVEYLNRVTIENSDYIAIIKRDEMVDNSSCGAGLRSVTIDGQGQIRPCVLFPKTKIFGNVFETSYSDIFKTDEYAQLAKVKAPGIDNGCDPNCLNLKQCQGCMLHAFDYLITNNLSCKWIEANNYERLYNYLKPSFE